MFATRTVISGQLQWLVPSLYRSKNPDSPRSRSPCAHSSTVGLPSPRNKTKRQKRRKHPSRSIQQRRNDEYRGVCFSLGPHAAPRSPALRWSRVFPLQSAAQKVERGSTWRTQAPGGRTLSHPREKRKLASSSVSRVAYFCTHAQRKRRSCGDIRTVYPSRRAQWKAPNLRIRWPMERERD